MTIPFVIDNQQHKKEPEESDAVHDLLAFQAEEMIRLNKEKRALQREFLDWLVATLKIFPDKEGRTGIDVLTGKAKLADYPGDYQKEEPPLATDELLEVLRKNKNRLGVSLSDAGLHSVSAASTAHTKKCYDPKFAMIVCHVLLVQPTYCMRSQNTKGSV